MKPSTSSSLRAARKLGCATLLLGSLSLSAATPTPVPVPTPTPSPAPILPVKESSIPIDAKETDYRLMPRDTVRVVIVEEIENTILQRISIGGEISVPMLGSVRLAGLTLREAEEKLQAAYIEGGYFMTPQVIISIEVYAPRAVQVLGQVNKPDQVPLQTEKLDIGIVEAITRAGGFTRTARTESVRVIRVREGREEQFSVNLTAYLEGKSSEPEFRLQPGDTVFVPERVF